LKKRFIIYNEKFENISQYQIEIETIHEKPGYLLINFFKKDGQNKTQKKYLKRYSKQSKKPVKRSKTSNPYQ
jgi:hypothetical protein